MKKKKFNKYLEDRYKDQLKWYDRESSKNKKYYRTFQITAIIFSVLTPIMIILSFDYSKIISVIFSCIVAILTSLIATLKFYENWVNYRTTCELLKKEKHYYTFEIGEYKNHDNKESLFVENVEDLISREHSKWKTVQKKDINKIN